ncbi:MAG: peptidase [Nitrosopumilaceae archaeon]|nr:peptidase [Nitrosopumilaceae archaeon]
MQTKTTILALIFAALLVSLVSASAAPAFAEVPPWIKNNAAWWSEGQISEAEFLTGIEYLISSGTITVPADPAALDGISDDTAGAQEKGVPEWVKNNAAWWADDLISDDDFLNGIQYLVRTGLITVSVPAEPGSAAETGAADPASSEPETDSVLAELEAQLAECAKITKAYKRIDCEKPVKQAILMHDYRTNAELFSVGPINYYWFGMGSEGNSFEITSSGQALLSLRILAENTNDEIESLDCTSPSLCNYDVWDGSTAFRYAGTDFTSGQIALNPGDAREFNMLFGPNVGYGGSQFLYDESKEYHFRINESFGSMMVPLDLGRN